MLLDHNASWYRPSPKSTCYFIDKATVWIAQPLSVEQLALVRQYCLGKVFVRNGHLPSKPKLIQRLQLNQPTQTALSVLATRIHHLNYIEIAVDHLYADDEQLLAASHFVDVHHVQRNHQFQRVKIIGRTRYSAKRTASNNFTAYDDKPSKITRGRNCQHLEWRLRGARSLYRAGISTVSDLIAIDHRAFWKDRLTLQRLDLEKFGRLLLNRSQSKKRRRPEVYSHKGSSIRINYDARVAIQYIRKLEKSRGSSFDRLQDLVDEVGSSFAIRRCLVPVLPLAYLP